MHIFYDKRKSLALKLVVVCLPACLGLVLILSEKFYVLECIYFFIHAHFTETKCG